MNLLKSLAPKVGIDKSIAYSSGARFVQAFTGLISVFFISTFLTGAEQGYYYTFGSLVAIQVFFELGFTGIITQYVAHEMVHLKWSKDGTLLPNNGIYKSRLASLLRFCIKWYSVISIALLIVLSIFGFVFFNTNSQSNEPVNWQLPWILIVIGTAIKLFQSPFNSFLMGIGKVKEMSEIGFWQQVIIPALTWIGLAYGIDLYVVGISNLIAAIIWFIYILRFKLNIVIIDLLKVHLTDKISYMKEIFPYQWRIALSWISGYFIFQLFNPVLFATEGAVVAGQMGMTLSVLNAIQAFGMSWISTKIPMYSGLVAENNYHKLDSVFNKTLKQQAAITIILLFFMFIGVQILRIIHVKISGNLLADRFLANGPMLLMMLTIVFNIFTSSWATYLRCHKREPFLLNSLVNGIACLLSTFLLGNIYGLWGITGGYCIITFLNLFWAYWIFKTNKTKWH